MSVHWHVLRSKPRKEAALARYARSNGHEVFYPTIPVKPVNPRASKIKPYFPGYLFVQTTLAELGESTFRWMPFSNGLVWLGGEPAVVPDPVVGVIMRRVEEIWEVGGLTFDGLKKGDRVLIQDGYFEGYQAIFDIRLPGSERVRVLLKMLSDRYVPVEIDEGLITRVTG